MIYLDYSATTPMSDKAIETYTKVAKDYFGNPSSLHDYGMVSSQIVEYSRKIISSHINGQERGLYFTSGGSESNFLVITTLVKAYQHRGKHLITTVIEHPSVLNTFQLLERDGFTVTYLPVNSFGQVELSTLEKAIRKDTILVSICHASSELGTIQEISQIGHLLKKREIIFHSDCVQTFGKIPIDVQQMNLDSISLSAHKIYGPKGVGACYINPRLSWKGIIPNVTHEKGFRQGTLNAPAIAAFAEASVEMIENMETEQSRLKKLQTLFLSLIDSKKIVLEGHPTKRLNHHLCLRTIGIEGQYMMLECNRRGIAISTGSACKVGQSGPSNSMLAIGKSITEAHEMIRITFGKFTTEKDVKTTVSVLHEIIESYFQK